MPRASVILFAAALYNLIWGALAVVAPVQMLAWVGIDDARYPEFWQCIGLLVGLYGVAYWFASTDPVRYRPFVWIGLLGKILGPVGAWIAIDAGRLPASFLWVNLTNDFVWWIPFAWVLYTTHRWQASNPAKLPLYQRLLGPAFDSLTPHLRHFHSATDPIEVRGTFQVTRGDSRIGNWLTDRAHFPRPHDSIAVSLLVTPSSRGEIWHRTFAGTVIESFQFEACGLLAERFGPLVLYLQPRAPNGALEVVDVRSTLCGMPLPRYLSPRVYAYGIDQGPAIDVDVRISCAPFGLLVRYKGMVEVAWETPQRVADRIEWTRTQVNP